MEPLAPAIGRERPEECAVGDWVLVQSSTGPKFRGATADPQGRLVMLCGKIFEQGKKGPQDGRRSSRWVRVG